jgi:hypothetical protein
MNLPRDGRGGCKYLRNEAERQTGERTPPAPAAIERFRKVVGGKT